MQDEQVPFIVGNRPCSACPKLEHSQCFGCQKVYCRSHAISQLSWTKLNYRDCHFQLILCQECLQKTVETLVQAKAALALMADYEV